jgi:hypothetical protein
VEREDQGQTQAQAATDGLCWRNVENIRQPSHGQLRWRDIAGMVEKLNAVSKLSH